MEVEKNDVNIDKLFVWGKEFVLEDGDGKELAKVYMRLLGDADTNKARVYALRKSAELRKELSDVDSDLRWATIKQEDAMELEDLYNMITVFSLRQITNEASRQVSVPAPKPPRSNAPLSKMEKYQKELDEYPAKRQEAMNKYIKKEVESLRAFLAKDDKSTIYRRYVNSLIDEFCEREAIRAYSDMELYLGCYKDADYEEKFFSSFEKFDNLDETQKEMFKTAYSNISIGMDELKKLRVATP